MSTEVLREVNIRELIVGKQYAEIYGRNRVNFTIKAPPVHSKAADGDDQYSAIGVREDGREFYLLETVGYECYRVGSIYLVEGQRGV